MDKIHDFTRKLQQPGVAATLREYVNWRQAVRDAKEVGAARPPMPDIGPVSINLDLTTACNFRCDHCIDWDVLNLKVRHREEELKNSIRELHRRSLKSVIVIGGGEPTLYPRFSDFIAFLKQLDLQVAVVSNGSRGDRLAEAARHMSRGDWIRLSLDAGSNQLFQEMHKPVNKVSLDEICGHVPDIRSANPDVQIGFSFIIVWDGAMRSDIPIRENIGEIALAAKRAKDAGFHYITYKAVLERREDGPEVMDPEAGSRPLEEILSEMRAELSAAHALEDDTFRVTESTNIKALESGAWQQFKEQPHTCHMQLFRQVLTPLGIYNCPAHRGVDWARIGSKDRYSDPDQARDMSEATADMLNDFDAKTRCADVTCIYNETNWWLEDLIAGRAELPAGVTETSQDYFL